MPRRARKNLNTSFFHVITQGINKEYIFDKDTYKRKYLKIVKEAKEQYYLDIVAYAIMSNHCHFLIYTENIQNLSSFMKKVNEDYARYYNYKENRVGYVFRNRFLSEPITDRKYLLQCISYIHNNPVKAKIVNKCEDYKYSSYNDFIKSTGFIDKKIIELIFGSKKLDVNLYKELHMRKSRNFLEFDNMLEEEMEEIILELEQKYNKKWDEIIKTGENIKELVYIIKERVNISNRELSKHLKIDRNAINRIVKSLGRTN